MTSRNTGIEARKCTWLHKICIGERKKADILNRKNFLLKFIVLGCYAPSIFDHFAANTFLYLPRVLVCEFCSPFSHLYIFFPTEWTLSISSWIIFYSRICPFFTRREVLSITSAISFRVNSYQFFLGDKFVFALFI